MCNPFFSNERETKWWQFLISGRHLAGQSRFITAYATHKLSLIIYREKILSAKKEKMGMFYFLWFTMKDKRLKKKKKIKSIKNYFCPNRVKIYMQTNLIIFKSYEWRKALFFFLQNYDFKEGLEAKSSAPRTFKIWRKLFYSRAESFLKKNSNDERGLRASENCPAAIALLFIRNVEIKGKKGSQKNNESLRWNALGFFFFTHP